jgi:hypothetical protein
MGVRSTTKQGGARVEAVAARCSSAAAAAAAEAPTDQPTVVVGLFWG